MVFILLEGGEVKMKKLIAKLLAYICKKLNISIVVNMALHWYIIDGALKGSMFPLSKTYIISYNIIKGDHNENI